MVFSINSVAKEYVYRRFSESSIKEKEKIILDWTNKVESAKVLVCDFTKKIGNPLGKKILDAGSGNGGISIAFGMVGSIPVGIEIEKELHDISQEHAKLYNSNARFILYDGIRIPITDNYFEAAISFSVLEHTNDPVLYLSEILRVIKPNGYLYLGFPNKLWPKETHTGLWFLTYMPSKL